MGGLQAGVAQCSGGDLPERSCAGWLEEPRAEGEGAEQAGLSAPSVPRPAGRNEEYKNRA